MRVSHVALDDFRSWGHVVIELPAGPTVFLGANGQGKTNLIEAIAYLSTFSSHRVSAESSLVRIPLDVEERPPAGAFVRVKTALEDDRSQVLELEIVRGKANRARINRTNVKPKDILGLVRTVVFAPEDLQIVRGDPSVRRAFLDDIAVQIHPLYSQTKSDFDRVARQRAALMKQAQVALRRGRIPDISTLSVWDERFAELSSQVTAMRASLVRRLSDPVATAYDDVADSPRHLVLAMDASIDRKIGTNPDDPTSADLENVEAQTQRLLAALERLQDQEMERGVNLVGAHRDDLSLRLGHMPVKGFASHGESWSVGLALRLGAFDLLADDGETPILILDDVFAELDTKRRAGLTTRMDKADQVLITAAVEGDIPPELDAHVVKVAWSVDNGSEVQE
ncbi:MAG: DNA replication/repair protein RecF [Schaalia turicensis]|nr:DNA replication/repair protein RecF [Schaalia turicensis]